jgi:hypothetical protein
MTLRIPSLGLVVGAALAIAGVADAQQPLRPAAFPGFGGATAGLVINNNGRPYNSQPLIAQLNDMPGCSVGTGNKEIVFGTFNPAANPKIRRLNVLCHKTGTTWGSPTGWPINLTADPNSAAVGDLTGDGVPEIVVGYGSTFDQAAHGGVKAFRLDGTTLWTFNTLDVDSGPNSFSDAVVSTPAIGDIDNDGANEVVFGSFDQHLYVVTGSAGVPKPGWTSTGTPWGTTNGKWLRDSTFSSPALHDLDGDGRLEILIGVDVHEEGPPVNTLDGGFLHVFRYDGSTFPGFPKFVDQQVGSAPVVGDIDGDGRPEIVHGTGFFWTDANNGANQGPPLPRLYAWECDGSAVPGWPVTITGQSEFEPALADLNGDSILDVVVASRDVSNNTFWMQAFRGTGAALFTAKQPRDFNNGNLSISTPIVADVLGDGNPEILVPSNSEAVVFSSTGTQLTENNGVPTADQPSFAANMTLANVTVGDLNNDGTQEVVAISSSPWPTETNTEVWAWNPKAGNTAPAWGAQRRTTNRTGVAPNTFSCAGCVPAATATQFFSITPCRAFDSRNGGSGGPFIGGAARRTLDLRTACPQVPTGAVAATLNVTTTSPSADGYVSFVMGGCTAPATTQTTWFKAGGTRANNATLPLSANGTCQLGIEVGPTVGLAVHVIVDVTGYFTAP